MSTFNMMTGRTQVLVDEQQLQQVQAELARRGLELERLKAAMETLSSVNGPAHFMAAAMALCNELASRWSAERVGIGFLRGRYVRLRALSHTEKITRNMQLVQDIEAAMEECLDQDVEVLLPPPKDASFVYRATENLSVKHGPSAICSFPLRRSIPGKKPEERGEKSDVAAVLTLERKADKPFKLEEIEALRLTSDLLTARLVDLYERDRWIGAKAAQGTRKALAWAVGPKHTWAKTAAIAATAFIAFAVLKSGPYRVEAPFTFEAAEQQVIAAPFSGTITKARARVGDAVWSAETTAKFQALADVSPLVDLVPLPRPASVLAELDTVELEQQLVNAVAQQKGALVSARVAHDKGDFAEEDKQKFEAEKWGAEAELARLRIDRASIKSPIDGVIFQGDLDKKIGAPVKEGDALFLVGRQDKLRGELSVPEDQIGALRQAQLERGQLRGELKATAFPGDPIRFTVGPITPMTELSETKKNVVKVRVTLDPADGKSWMWPGIEGLAKVDVGEEKLAWLWTHRMINWVRLKLWSWF